MLHQGLELVVPAVAALSPGLLEVMDQGRSLVPKGAGPVARASFP